MEVFDLVILGGGSAAFAAALKATELGAEVALCEEWVIGGTCLNRGCIPSKHLLRVSEVFHYSRSHPFRGVEIPEGRVDFGRVMEEKDRLVGELREEKYLNILRESEKIHYFEGSASFVSRDTVRVGERLLRGRKFLIATGARPQVVPFRGIEGVDFLNSTTALDLRELPPSMIILGGRFVAVEMAQIFSRFGTKVTILQRSPRIIPEEEEEISEGLRKYLKEEGIGIHTGVKVEEVSQEGGMKRVRAMVDGEEALFEAHVLLMATGITPNTERLNLEVAEVETDERGFVEADEFMGTSNPDVFAAGDVVGRLPLVTVAAHEGALAAVNALHGPSVKADYSAVPHAIFTSPNVASVGLTERKAREKGHRVVSRRLDLRHVPKARAIKDTRGFIKIVAEEGTERVLGIHILAPEAAEVIHQGVLAIMKGMTVRDLAGKIDVYPTLSEMVKLCAQSFYKDVGRLSCCAE